MKNNIIKYDKVIFLDIDGVLNCVSTSNFIKGNDGIKYAGIESAKIKLLKKIIDATDSYLVISSTWRKYEEFMAYLEKKLGKKYKSRIIGYTRVFDTYCTKDKEILDWLNHQDVRKYIILDDDDDFKLYEVFGDSYFKTYYSLGLTEAVANSCIEYLNKK